MKTSRLKWSTQGRPISNALKAQWHASVFPRFFSWWFGELHASLPPRLRQLIERDDEEQTLVWQDGELWMNNPADRRLYDNNSVMPKHCVILLPARQALVKTISLPAAAAQDLSAALSFEMDRHTPFKASQVYYATHRWPSHSPQSLELVLAVVLRERLDVLLEKLVHLGIHPTAIDVQTEKDARLGVNLLPPERRKLRHKPRRLLNVGLTALSVMLLFATLQFWLHNREETLAAMQQEVAHLRSTAHEIDDLRQQLQNDLGATRYLTERKRAIPPLSAVLSELTHCLPPDTWLSNLNIETDGQVRLAGQSQRAGALINELKKCPSLTRAQFQGVIQPDETTGQERFYLLAYLRREDVGNASNSDTP
ncbi:PilN domain-containing protein [Phytohalomonas tamaricis]|uniref:PilN domain-containing protein n=1 Tax=Phytohalomonas tamaricis TaxID=2081032 RepID=UPI001319EEE8|nr:PilN domain-containing protein [Phytohalomonas tamaricis]